MNLVMGNCHRFYILLDVGELFLGLCLNSVLRTMRNEIDKVVKFRGVREEEDREEGFRKG